MPVQLLFHRLVHRLPVERRVDLGVLFVLLMLSPLEAFFQLRIVGVPVLGGIDGAFSGLVVALVRVGLGLGLVVAFRPRLIPFGLGLRAGIGAFFAPSGRFFLRHR